MNEEKGKFQFAGLKFLFDMELVDDPQLINHLKLNILSVSPSIKDVELLTSYAHKSILIWIDLSWLGRKFSEKRIVAVVTDRVQQLLPNFRFRVVTDKKILDLAIERLKAAIGGKNEKVPNKSPSDAGTGSSPSGN